jgi:gas vesicle protein
MTDYRSSDPDEIRAEIEITRTSLGDDVDALTDKVTPSKIVQREKNKVKSALGSVTERVMGTASDAQQGAASAADGLADIPHRAVAKAEGNPLAVGLIAFGAGLLAASLFPPTEKEKRLAGSVKDAAQPLVDELGNAAKDVADNLREPTQEAAQAVKEQATEAVESVKSEATGAADDLADEAAQAKHAVQDGSAPPQ